MFWTSRLISDDLADWTFDVFEWLIVTYGPAEFFSNTRLVLPTKDFFAAGSGTDHRTAEAVFDDVRRLMGMREWPCRLIRQEGEVDPWLGETALVNDAPAMPGGTFGSDGTEFVITYSPDLMHSPIGFIAMLAHELAHYLLAGEVEAAPGGAELHEYVTDIAAIYSGFGILQLQGGFVAEQTNQGWKIGTLGYLSSEHRAFALALFMVLKDIDLAAATPHLTSDRARLLKRGFRMLEARGEQVDALRALTPG